MSAAAVVAAVACGALLEKRPLQLLWGENVFRFVATFLRCQMHKATRLYLLLNMLNNDDVCVGEFSESLSAFGHEKTQDSSG